MFCANTGYQGRIGVYELLRLTPEVKALVASRATYDQVRDQAIAPGHEHPAQGGRPARRRGRHHRRRGRPQHLRPLGLQGNVVMKLSPFSRRAEVESSAGSPLSAQPADLSAFAAAGDYERHLGDIVYGSAPAEVAVDTPPKSTSSFFDKKVKPKELMQFSRQLAAFVRAGIPIPGWAFAPGRGHHQPDDEAGPGGHGGLASPRRLALVCPRAQPQGVLQGLPQHAALGRADRQPRHGAREGRRLPRARRRGAQQDQGGERLPDRHRRHGGGRRDPARDLCTAQVLHIL